MNRQYSQRLPAKSDGSVRGSGRFRGALTMPDGRIPWGFCNSAAVPAAVPHGSGLFFAAHHASATWLPASSQLYLHSAPFVRNKGAEWTRPMIYKASHVRRWPCARLRPSFYSTPCVCSVATCFKTLVFSLRTHRSTRRYRVGPLYVLQSVTCSQAGRVLGPHYFYSAVCACNRTA